MAPKPTKREVWMLSCTCVEGIIVLHDPRSNRRADGALVTLLVSVVLCLLDETGAEARLHGCTDRQRFENE